MTGIQRKYKDRLFSFLFGHEENKKWTLSLYNAVNGTDYQDPEEIRITTIREILYMGMRNDLSFLIACEVNIFEQQSSFNPNMPLRQMQYAANQFERYITEMKFNKYGSRLIPLPAPKLITFYNGTRKQPDEQILRLSDSFPENADSDIEVRVRMININKGRNPDLVKKCEALQEYAWLVAGIRKNQKRMKVERAVDKAIRDMPGSFEIRPFLEAHRAEVMGMLLTEYDEVRTMELFRKDGYEEGMEDGQREERKTAIGIMRKTLLKLGHSEEEVDRILRENYPDDLPLVVHETKAPFDLKQTNQ